jgi:hypothetical protein
MNFFGPIVLALFLLVLLRKRAARIRLIRELGYDPGPKMESYRWINAATILTALTFLASLGLALTRRQ